MIYDVVIIGAGASGLMCASSLKGKILVLEKNNSAGAKILVSGGGKCNFTNLNMDASHYYSTLSDRIPFILENWSVDDCLKLISSYNIKYEKKDKTKLFAESAKKILSMLENECKKNKVEFRFGVDIKDVLKIEDEFVVDIGQKIKAKNIVIASGGKSYSHLGASDFGLRFAKQFKLKLVQNQPALVGLKYPNDFKFLSVLSGVSLPVRVKIKDKIFEDNLLFAHYGITGPVILNASLYVDVGDELEIDFLPFNSFKTMPKRVQKVFMDYFNIMQKDRVFSFLKQFKFPYITSFGYDKAEVMRGGVSLSYLTENLENSKINGMYFIGEVLDITGELGGYNIHMAFATAKTVSKSINNKILSTKI